MHGLRAIDQLGLKQPFDWRPSFVDAVVESGAYRWTTNVDTVEATFSVAVRLHFCEEALKSRRLTTHRWSLDDQEGWKMGRVGEAGLFAYMGRSLFGRHIRYALGQFGCL